MGWMGEKETMAEEHILIDDILKNQAERMLYLKKYYPFFVLQETTLSQYKEGRFQELDMGYITMALLRFLIQENHFNGRNVTYPEVEYMASQEKFSPAWLLNFSVGKSWYIQRTYQLGFSLNAKNLLNNTWVKTGGYEQNRIVKNTVAKQAFYRFDSKYFYMSGFNYMLNIYFRF